MSNRASKDPTNADLHLRLGDLYLAWHLDIYSSCQYIDEAITEYQIALESYIDSYDIYYKIGRAQFLKVIWTKLLIILKQQLKRIQNSQKRIICLLKLILKSKIFGCRN